MFQNSTRILSDELSQSDASIRHVRVAIVGTGFSGLGMAIQLKRHGYDDFVVLEKATEGGGTWRDNTYPGCACDAPSYLYSFSFALNPQWSRVFAPQSEIQKYLRLCIEQFGILPYIQWNSELQDASWNEKDQRWHITTTQNQLLADILVLGNGPLSEPSLPSIPGMKQFEGTLFHSAQWKHDYDLTGKCVAVIGTGASAIQFLPHIQPRVGRLTLFQRTPPWIVPRHDHPIAAWQRILFRILPITQRILRSQIYWQRELITIGFVYRPKLLEAGMNIARKHLATQVVDPVLRAKLMPDYTFGCKRVLLSDNFYPALTQSNVEVVSDRIREVRAQSILTEEGKEYEVDTIICATGFHTTDMQFPQRIHGRGSRSLANVWHDGPHAYYGTTVAAFPNLFLLVGPNAALSHNSNVFMAQSQMNYILDCLHMMDKRHVQTIELLPDAEEKYNVDIQQRMKDTVWTSGCASWYLDARGHNTTLWPGFSIEFWYKTRHFDPQHYSIIPQRTDETHVPS